MKNREIIEEHDSVLSAVLNEAQFCMYRDSFERNPDGR